MRGLGREWKGPGRSLGGAWEESGSMEECRVWDGATGEGALPIDSFARDLRFWEESGRSLGGVWEEPGRSLGGVWDAVVLTAVRVQGPYL